MSPSTASRRSLTSRVLGFLRAGLQRRSSVSQTMAQTENAQTSDVNASSQLLPPLSMMDLYDEQLVLDPFRFLDLPTEIRLAMYQTIFADSRLFANKDAAFEHNPPWGKVGHGHDEIKHHQILLTCHHCYDEGRVIFYDMTSWFVHSPQAALWEFGHPQSVFWTHLRLVKVMHIWANGESRMLLPAEFPALQQLVFHLETPKAVGWDALHGTNSAVPSFETMDDDVVMWIKTSADYTFFVKPFFDIQRSFTVSVVVMLKDERASDQLGADLLSSILYQVNLDTEIVVRSRPCVGGAKYIHVSDMDMYESAWAEGDADEQYDWCSPWEVPYRTYLLSEHRYYKYLWHDIHGDTAGTFRSNGY